MPQLSPAHLAALALGGMVVLVALFCLAFVVLQIRNRSATTPIYDMRLVEEKTARPAYRVRLRLFVFSSQVASVSTRDASLSGRLWQHLIRQPFPWSSLMEVYRDRRGTRPPKTPARPEHQEVHDPHLAPPPPYPPPPLRSFAPPRLPPRKAPRCPV